MSEHPIQGMMTTAMESIKDMVDVNTIIGEAIETTNNVIIIPISKVSFGFAAGGSEFKGEALDEYSRKDKDEEIQYRLPFGGGSGAGVSINPIAFLVVQNDKVKLLPVSYSSTIDKLLDYIPDLLDKTNTVLNKTIDEIIDDKKERREKPSSNKKRRVEDIVPKEEEQVQAQPSVQPSSIIRTSKPKREKVSIKETPEETEYEYEYAEEDLLDDE